MRPQEIVVALGDAEHKEWLAELSIDNRALRLVLARYIERFGLLPELAAAPPAAPPEEEE